METTKITEIVSHRHDIAYGFAAYSPSFRRVFIRSNKGRSPGLYSLTPFDHGTNHKTFPSNI